MAMVCWYRVLAINRIKLSGNLCPQGWNGSGRIRASLRESVEKGVSLNGDRLLGFYWNEGFGELDLVGLCIVESTVVFW